MLAKHKPLNGRSSTSLILAFLCVACGGGTEGLDAQKVAIPTVDSALASAIVSGANPTNLATGSEQPPLGAATSEQDNQNSTNDENSQTESQTGNSTSETDNSSATSNTPDETPSQSGTPGDNAPAETDSTNSNEPSPQSSTTPEENTSSGQEQQTESETNTSDSGTDTEQSSSNTDSTPPPTEPYDVYGGELASNESLGAIQCLAISDTDKSFGEVTADDWRDWLTGYTYSLRPEHLETGIDNGEPYFRQQLIPTSIGSHHVQAGANLASSRTYRLTQTLFFEPEFDWGGSNEGGKVGFGLGGGSAPSGGVLQTDGFTLRLMWRGNGDGTARLVAYSYAADRSQHLPYGDDYILGNFEIPVGSWFEVTIEVKTNSTTEQNDGSLRVWVGSDLALQRDNVTWQSSGGQPAVQKLIYTTFYGGNDSSWAPSQTTHIRFGEACWAPVETQNGSFQDDLDQSIPYAASVLLEDAIKSPRGQLISTLSNIEILLPIQSADLNSQTYTALDSLNLALNNHQWTTDNDIQLDSHVIANLALSVNQLTGNLADESTQPYLATEMRLRADAIVSAAISIIKNKQEEINYSLQASGCNLNSSDASCVVSQQHLSSSVAWLDNAATDGMSNSEKMRQSLVAWTELVKAADFLE